MRNVIVTAKDYGTKKPRGRWLSVKEVADYLRIDKRKIQHQMKTGRFPLKWYLFDPTTQLIDSADLDDYLERVCIPAGGSPQ